MTPETVSAIDPEQAREQNERIPLKLLGAAARPFTVGPPEARAVATECLARAIYYEARSESVSGQRAVAQVVLNRVRHPAFAPTICGVVYQGHERATGCQFTFACDGSQAIKPMGQRWTQAIKVAQQALGGFVDKDVGWATHYHADYVLPYWVSELDKIAVIGRHIFYRWSGGWGVGSAFRQQYVAAELDPMAGVSTPQLATDANIGTDADRIEAGAIMAKSPLLADQDSKNGHEATNRLAVDEEAAQLREELQVKPRLRIDENRQ